MTINDMIAKVKAEEHFSDNVGMILVHNGIVRGWSRADKSPVRAMRIRHDAAKMEAIRAEIEARPGIFRVYAHAIDGELKAGDDVLYLLVAGDIRENVKAALADLLDRVKSEAVHKEEVR